jgi:superkiller protein 3
MLGNVQKDVLEYDVACQTFRDILRTHPNEFSVTLSLAQTLLTWAYWCYRTGEFSKCIDLAIEGVTVALKLINDKEELREAWKLMGDGAYLGSLVHVDGISTLYHLINEKLSSDEFENLKGEEEDPEKTKIMLLRCNISAMEKMVALTEGDRLANSAAHFNLGLSKFRLVTVESPEPDLNSIRPILECFKKAIQSEPRNFQYWNVLGVVTARHFPSVAEKAFSRSLQINDRVPIPSGVNLIVQNAGAWTNLGIMYLMHDDDELAAQAFSRSQAIDPENSVAWLAQAILAVRRNDPLEASQLYQHAFEIGERSFVLAVLSDTNIGDCQLSIRGDCVRSMQITGSASSLTPVHGALWASDLSTAVPQRSLRAASVEFIIRA